MTDGQHVVKCDWRSQSRGIRFRPLSPPIHFRMATAAPVQEKETASAKKPAKVIRLRGVSVSIFENSTKKDGRDVTFHKATFQRVYKKAGDNDEFGYTASFSRDDLPVLKMVIDQAWEFMLGMEPTRDEDEEESE